MFFFINHTKKSIVRSTKDAKTNISNSIFEAIRSNKWSIGDHIEFIEYINCSKIQVKELIEAGYECMEANWFYF